MLVLIDNNELVRLRTELTRARFNSLSAKCTCDRCKHLSIFNDAEIYAVCHKTGYIFNPFDTDTRKHFCSFAEGK